MPVRYRVQIYHWDMGLFRKAYITAMTQAEIDEENASRYRKAVLLTPDNHFGKKLLDVLR